MLSSLWSRPYTWENRTTHIIDNSSALQVFATIGNLWSNLISVNVDWPHSCYQWDRYIHRRLTPSSQEEQWCSLLSNNNCRLDRDLSPKQLKWSLSFLRLTCFPMTVVLFFFPMFDQDMKTVSETWVWSLLRTSMLGLSSLLSSSLFTYNLNLSCVEKSLNVHFCWS